MQIVDSSVVHFIFVHLLTGEADFLLAVWSDEEKEFVQFVLSET